MYKVKFIKQKKRSGYAVMNGDRVVNDWLYPDKKDAEKKLKILRVWYEK